METPMAVFPSAAARLTPKLTASNVPFLMFPSVFSIYINTDMILNLMVYSTFASFCNKLTNSSIFDASIILQACLGAGNSWLSTV